MSTKRGNSSQPKSQAGIRTIPLAHQVAEAVRRQLPHGTASDDLAFAHPLELGAGRAPLSRHLFRHVYRGAVDRLTDPTSELSRPRGGCCGRSSRTDPKPSRS